MRRREFIRLVSGAAAAWPFTVRAQQGDRIRRIGVLTGTRAEDAEIKARNAAFEQALQQLGWSRAATYGSTTALLGAMPPPAANKRRNWSRSRRTSSCPLAAFRQDNYFR